LTLDDAYETLQLDWHPARIWDCARKCWRNVLLAPWRVGAPPRPAEPDALLDAACAEGGYPGETIYGTTREARQAIVLAYLREHGPSVPYHMTAALGVTHRPIDLALHALEARGLARQIYGHYRLGNGLPYSGRRWEATEANDV